MDKAYERRRLVEDVIEKEASKWEPLAGEFSTEVIDKIAAVYAEDLKLLEAYEKADHHRAMALIPEVQTALPGTLLQVFGEPDGETLRRTIAALVQEVEALRRELATARAALRRGMGL